MRSTPQDASSSKISSATTSALLCRTCGKPVSVETAKADAGGKAIHEQRYALKGHLENATKSAHGDKADGMTDGTIDGTGTRPWKVVAAEVSHEHDPKKLSQLVSELNRAMDEQGIGKSPNQQKK